MTRGSTASFDSRITSPVDGSTTSVAANAPSSSASETSTSWTPAFFMAAIAFEVIFLPACVMVSAPALISFAARRPIRLSPTAHWIEPPFRCSLSTV